MSNARFVHVADLLEYTAKLVEKALNQPEDEALRLGIVQNLHNSRNRLGLLTGTTNETNQIPNVRLGPATTMGGQKIKRTSSNVKESDLYPTDESMVEYRSRVDRAYIDILKLSPQDVLMQIPDVVLRGLAKLLGHREITKNSPLALKQDFIEQMQDEIRDRNDAARINALKKTTKPAIPAEGGIDQNQSILVKGPESPVHNPPLPEVPFMPNDDDDNPDLFNPGNALIGPDAPKRGPGRPPKNTLAPE